MCLLTTCAVTQIETMIMGASHGAGKVQDLQRPKLVCDRDCTRSQWQALKRLQDGLLRSLTPVRLGCSLDNSIIIWDPAKGQKLATLEGHKSYVKGIAWDPIGKYLASQSDDRTVKVGARCETRIVAISFDAGACFPRNALAESAKSRCQAVAGIALHAVLYPVQKIRCTCRPSSVCHAVTVHPVRWRPICVPTLHVPPLHVGSCQHGHSAAPVLVPACTLAAVIRRTGHSEELLMT